MFFVFVLVGFFVQQYDLTFYLEIKHSCDSSVGKRGGEWGKQVGSMIEESQVSSFYNFYLHQPGNSVCVGKDTNKQNI